MPAIQRLASDNALFAIEGSNTAWEKVLHKARRLSYPKHHEIPTSGSGDFYYLISGRLKLSCLAADGQERIVMRIGPGSLFNEVSHLHHSPHAHSLQTLTPCEVAAFPGSLLDDEKFYREHPDLIRNLVQTLGLKAGAFFAQLFDSGLLEVRGRVCRMLYQLWEENGRKASFRPELSQGDMAAMLGVHRSSLCRELRTLREEGVIGSFSKANLEILLPEVLAGYLKDAAPMTP